MSFYLLCGDELGNNQSKYNLKWFAFQQLAHVSVWLYVGSVVVDTIVVY